RQCYGWSLPYGVSLHGEEDFDAAGELLNPRVRERLGVLARDGVVYGALLWGPFPHDLGSGGADSFAGREPEGGQRFAAVRKSSSASARNAFSSSAPCGVNLPSSSWTHSTARS